MSHKTYSVFLLGMVLASCAAGCFGSGASDAPELLPVTGKVTSNGQPVVGATVEFTPQNGGTASTAITDTSGLFELTYSDGRKGAVPTLHRVTITEAFAASATADGSVRDPGKPPAPPRETTQEVLVEESQTYFELTF